ncbi:META domain-containing protein [Steroidobacter sp.]|uniref:META domain-containing protein n=1 Tax=Steroidobacter sp. TaxID=1978227 RepID=UPI001A51DCC9|nr:META domain-containing protein [Steroidobacter sp.]MBL8270167.1 META domain-containing protein [Steroidobacter sp.]
MRVVRLDSDLSKLYVGPMKAHVWIVATLLAMSACSGPESGSPESQPPPTPAAAADEVTHELAGTRWALVQLGDQPVTVSEGGREAYIALNSSDGSVVGHAGCNRISTTYKQTGAQISFGDVIATRMFCPDMPIETALLQVMKAATGWRISGAQLELLDNQQIALARFEAKNL